MTFCPRQKSVSQTNNLILPYCQLKRDSRLAKAGMDDVWLSVRYFVNINKFVNSSFLSESYSQ